MHSHVREPARESFLEVGQRIVEIGEDSSGIVEATYTPGKHATFHTARQDRRAELDRQDLELLQCGPARLVLKSKRCQEPNGT
jgi:hypothetical protein